MDTKIQTHGIIKVWKGKSSAKITTVRFPTFKIPKQLTKGEMALERDIMSNYSKTTLRELKKRYLNILKKCFLLNLVVSVSLTFSSFSMAGESRLENTGEKEYNQIVTFENLTAGNQDGGAIKNNTTGIIKFNDLAIFKNNSAFESGGAIMNYGQIEFNGGVKFIGNILNSEEAMGGAIRNKGNKASLQFKGTILNIKIIKVNFFCFSSYIHII